VTYKYKSQWLTSAGGEELFGSWIVVLEEENSTVTSVRDALGAKRKNTGEKLSNATE
jgi:hypothetical protein